MRVRCTKILYARGVGGPRLEKQEGAAITVGAEYAVVMIDLRPTGLYFHIVDDQEQLTSWLSEMFEVTDGRPASSWHVGIDADRSFVIAPEPWMRASFWTDWDRGTDEALQAYREEITRILAES
jgi:hypothetical protein